MRHNYTNLNKYLLIFLSLFISTPSLAAFKDNNNTIHWMGCGITKKAFMKELAVGFEKKTGVQVTLSGGGATKGIRNAAKLKVDIGGTCRMTLPEIDHSELHATLHPVAWDALAIITHKSNPVKSLTEKQIKAIYKGKIKNWRHVGGKNAPIELYTRKGSISGVGYAIRQYLFQNSSEIFTSKYQVPSSGPLEKGIEKNKNGIGITGISSARKRNIKVLAFDKKLPTYKNVKEGNYGLYRPLYLVTSPAPTKTVRSFINYAQSTEGKQIIRDNKTVPYADALNLMRKLLVYGFGVN